MERTIRRRRSAPRFAPLGTLVAVVCVMAALMPGPVGQASAGTKRSSLAGTLTVYAAAYTPAKPTKSNPHPATYLGTIVKNYEALHPGATIKLLPNVSQTSIAFTQWKATQFAGGIEPDIIYNNPIDANNIEVPKGWYVPLDQFLRKPNPYVRGNKAWADLFGKGILANVTNANGHIYNLPLDAIDTAIFYNKSAFAKAGIAGPPATFAEWMTDMAKLKKAGYIPYYLNAGAAGTDYMDWHERQLVDMLYHAEADKLHAIPGGSKGTYQLSTPQVVRAIQSGTFSAKDPRYIEVLTLLKQFASYAQPGFEGVSATGTPYSLFASGKLAMFEGTTFDVRGLANLHLRFPYGSFMAIPPITKATSRFATGAIPGKIGIVGAFANYNVTVATVKRDHNLALAIDFLLYLSQPSTGGRMITQLGALVPVIKNVPVPAGLKVFLPSSGRRDCLFPGYVARLDPQFATQYYKVLQIYLLGQLDQSAASAQMQQLMSAAATRIAAQSHIK
jgi:raffinose/stachyose/melibiose transport system substrate-binding protein